MMRDLKVGDMVLSVEDDLVCATGPSDSPDTTVYHTSIDL